MLAAARAKLVSTSAPAITRTDDTPSLPKWPLSWAVLGSLSAAASTTISLPSAALADSALRSASLRTFFGRSYAWLRTTGPNALPPPRNCGAASLPWRARPVPFWAYIFLAVAVTSARPLVLWVPCWRRDSCHTTQRCRMSWRTGTPNTASASSISPALPPSMVLTAIFMFPVLKPQDLQPPALPLREPPPRQQPCAGRPGTVHPWGGRAWRRP